MASASDGRPRGGRPGLLAILGITLAKVAAFIAIVLLVGPRVLPWMLRQVARTGSRELFTLCVLAVALGIAFGSAKLFGVSFALGAFFAGMVLHESDLSHKAATNSLPLQDAFAVLFFVSVGMLFDPSIILREPQMVAAVLLLILVGKSLVALGIVLVLGYPLSTALIVSASLAQIGEFSFILAGLGITYGLMDSQGLNLILAGRSAIDHAESARFRRRGPVDSMGASRPATQRALRGLAQCALCPAARKIWRPRGAAGGEKAAAHKTFTPEELVDRFPLFTGLTPEQREVLVLHFTPRTAQPGERIIRAGDKADSVYFISSGQVEVSVGGKRIKLGPGDFFGEMALISGLPRSADVTALDYSKFATLNRRDFRQFLSRYPDIRDEIAALATQRREMNRQLLNEAA